MQSFWFSQSNIAMIEMEEEGLQKKVSILTNDSIPFKYPTTTIYENMIIINNTLHALQEEEQAPPSDGDHDDYWKTAQFG